ncbi:hypothetical protein EK21DRAFT_110281 [Setomelanomma holmii]|uniref:Uncharacterized protein n=1 Tax=Setomelanomma holmii TaxID=210430 RepID=A0A9P4HCJ9_9PLEO|nr:hypothetical protein EK21DRAFT_110281 [Setomelanomma holmii]
MDPASVPLPETPNPPEEPTLAAIESPSVTATVLAASSTVPSSEDSNNLRAPLHRFIGNTANIVAPEPVRQGWRILFNTARDKHNTYPAIHRYGCLTLVVSIALAEYQQPGFVPRPETLTKAIIGLLCATTLVFGIIALQEYMETSKWPWQEEGWVWPWEAWLWAETVYDLSASTMSDAMGAATPAGQVLPTAANTPPSGMAFTSPALTVRDRTPISKASSDRAAIPPLTAFKQPFVIPPTPQLPPGMRPTYRPPPTPAQIHKSGLMGESPGPALFKNFGGSGNPFFDRAEKLRQVAQWSRPGPPSVNLRTGLEEKIVEKKIVEGTVGGADSGGIVDGRSEVHEDRRERNESLLIDEGSYETDDADTTIMEQGKEAE